LALTQHYDLLQARRTADICVGILFTIWLGATRSLFYFCGSGDY
jgi:hypothetical protein